MLIEFSVSNFRSFKSTQTLSLVKSSGSELEETNSFNVVLPIPATLNLLKSAVIYGANAAGKSNLLQAMKVMKVMKVMKDIVLTSSSEKQHGDKIPVTPFLFDSNTELNPTEFEIIFIDGSVRYQYGFSCTKKRICSEWLIAFPNGRAQSWFHRIYNQNQNTYDYKFSSFLKGSKFLWQKSTRDNALFLSTSVQLNSESFLPIFDWFKNKLTFILKDFSMPSLTIEMLENEKMNRNILNFIKSVDLNIEGFIVEKQKLSSEHVDEKMPKKLGHSILSSIKETELKKLKTVHKTLSGENVEMPFDDESDGTQRLFSLIGHWIDILTNGRILVIDELHNQLHPNLVKFLINLFHDPQLNQHHAQLIFTTHETTILSNNVFRRDQIWFCEKDKEQATNLYPLSDFSPRKGRENFEQYYLSGRYGAIPFFSDINF